MRSSAAAVSALLLAVSLSAAVVPGPEKPASPPAVTPAAADETLAVATDGKDFVVLWKSGLRLYAAKVTETGEISPKPSRYVTGGNMQSGSMVWTGDSYLALWSAGASVVAARLDRNANVVVEPFVVGSGSLHALAWDGRRAVAITNDDLGMKVLVLGPEGNLVRENRLFPERAGGDVRLVAAGDAFVMVWTMNLRNGLATIRAMRISRDGDAGASVKLPFPTSSGVFLDAEADGDRVGIALTEWPDPTWAPERPLRRYTLDANTLAITEHPAALAVYSPEVVATPGGFVSAVLTSRGTTSTLDVIPFESTNARQSTHIEPAGTLRTASNGRSVLAVWTGSSIDGAVFDGTLTRKETPVFPVSTSIIAQQGPELASAGDVALHIWGEGTLESGNLVAARVDRLGNALDPPRLIAGGESTSGGHEVAFTGQLWLVAYPFQFSSWDGHTLVRRIAADGVPIDEAPFDAGPYGPAVMASNGEVTLLAVLTTGGTLLHRFRRDGTPIDPAPTALPGTGAGALATNGREFLIVWWGAEGEIGPAKLLAKRIDAAGNIMDTAPIVIDDRPFPGNAFSVASDGTDYAVAFARQSGVNATEIVVKRVRHTGVLDGSSASGGGTVVGTGIAPRIAFLGMRAVVAYVSAPGQAPVRLYLAEVGGETVTIAESVLDHALVSRGNALWLSYSRIPDSRTGISRVFVRAVDDTPPSRRRTTRK